LIPTKINKRTPEFPANIATWETVVERHAKALQEARSEGKQSALDKHTSRGQLLGIKSKRLALCRAPLY
jgi:hypothetical protein